MPPTSICTGAFILDAAATHGMPNGFELPCIKAPVFMAGDNGGGTVGGEHEFVGDVLGELLTLMCVTGNRRVAAAAAAAAAVDMSRESGPGVPSNSRSIVHFRLKRDRRERK